MHHWQEALDASGRVLHVLLLHCCKAFDKVDHTALVTFRRTCVTRRLASFFCRCQWRTKIGDSVSDWSQPCLAGVLQGTLFGLVGFIIYINDLHTCLPTCKCMDDCTLRKVCSTGAADSQLQRTAIETVQWSSVNRMSVNCEQTKEVLMCFAHNKPDISTHNHQQ